MRKTNQLKVTPKDTDVRISRKDIKGHFVMRERLIHQDNTTLFNIYAPNNKIGLQNS